MHTGLGVSNMRSKCRGRRLQLIMNNHSGFTLVELLIVMVVAAVLLGLGVPSLRSTIESNRIATVSNELISTLQFAKSESIRRGEEVTVCSSTDAACVGGWAGGWLVRNAAGTIRVWPPARQGVAIAVTGPVVFNALGGAAAARCFQVNLNTLQRSVTVGAGGRIGSALTACP